MNKELSNKFIPSGSLATLTGWTIPVSGLGSNSNYVLYSNCDPLRDLSVTILVEQDVICDSTSGKAKGFSFQLNAYSPREAKTVFQQYVIALIGSSLIGAVDNWPVSGPNVINKGINLTSMLGSNIPAGYTLKMSLQNDTNGNISGVTYVVTDTQGNLKANETQTLQSITGVTSADLAPIIAFELNLVGPIGGQSAVLSSGAGRIVYTTSNVLTGLSEEPPCAEPGRTAETANSLYGALPANPSSTLTQSFGVSLRASIIRNQSKFRPCLIIQPSPIRKDSF